MRRLFLENWVYERNTTKPSVAVVAACVALCTVASWAQSMGEPAQAESAAWASAEKTGTPAAFREFYRKHPQSPYIKTVTGTLRGRYWFRLEDQQHREGVLVTVEGMNVLLNLSLKEALDGEVIGSSPIGHGVTFTGKGVTFNYIYVEMQGDATPHAENDRFRTQPFVIQPRDMPNSTIVLSADGTRFLTWDVRNAPPAIQASTKATFIQSAAAKPPFDDVPAGIDKRFTPESQGVSVKGQIPPASDTVVYSGSLPEGNTFRVTLVKSADGYAAKEVGYSFAPTGISVARVFAKDRVAFGEWDGKNLVFQLSVITKFGLPADLTSPSMSVYAQVMTVTISPTSPETFTCVIRKADREDARYSASRFSAEKINMGPGKGELADQYTFTLRRSDEN